MLNRPMGISRFTISSFPLVLREYYNFEEAEKAKKDIEKVIDEETKLIERKYENIFIGGFSQGVVLLFQLD